jgi:hypothetical protein
MLLSRIIVFLTAFALLGIITGIMAAWSGAGGRKYWRRFIMPGITTLLSIILLRTFNAAALMLRSVPLTFGYGMPDPTDPKPSRLGKFWNTHIKNMHIAAICTRASIGIVESLAAIPIPLIAGNTAGVWALWAWAAVFITAFHVVFGELVTGEGQFKLFGKWLLWEEVIIHGTNSIVIVLLAWLCR